MRTRAAAALAAALMCACGASTPPPAAPTTPTPAGPKGPVSIATFTGNSDAITSPFRIDVAKWNLQYTTTAQDCRTASVLILVIDDAHPGAFVRNLPLNGCTSGTAPIPFGPSGFYLKITLSDPSVSYAISVSEVR